MPASDPSQLIDGSSLVLAAFEAAPDPLVVVDRAGKVVLVNEQAERLFGYSRGAFMQLHIEDLIPMRLRSRHDEFHQRYCESPRLRPMGSGLETVALRSDGTEFDVEIALSPIRSSQSGHQLTAASIRPAGERDAATVARHRELQLREAEAEALVAAATRQVALARYDSGEYHRALADYTNLVRHRVANPLTVIQGMARTLLELPDIEPEVRRDMLVAIDEAAERLARETIFRPDHQGPEEVCLRPRPFDTLE